MKAASIPTHPPPTLANNTWPGIPLWSQSKPQPQPLGKAGAQPRYLPQIYHSAQPQGQEWSTPPVLVQPTPLPADFKDMPWSERRYWTKAREEQIKAIKMMQKAAKDQRKAQEKERKVMMKAEEKQRKRELK